MSRIILDVSNHQDKPIDFARVKREHPEVVGVIVKATEGSSFVDLMFAVHVQAAQAAGLLTGCYTFVRPSNVGTRDMQKFLDVTAPFQMRLGYWLDVETDDGVDPATLLARVVEKVKYVDTRKPGRTGFYTGPWFWNPKTQGSVAAHVEQWPLWLAAYSITMPPPPVPWTSPLLWQFTDAYPTHIGPVDASVWQGTDAQWADWTGITQPAPAPAPTPGGRVPTVTGVNMDRLHPVFADQLHQLAAVTGHDIYCQSTGRTDAEQDVLYQGWIHRLPGFNPANPPGGPSWHRYIPGSMHAQAADISTVGLGGASARSIFGPHAAAVGLSFAIASESWHIQPTAKHPEVPFGPTPETDVAIPLPTINPGTDQGHPSSVDLFCDLIRRINPSRDLTSAAARTQACRDFQTLFKIAGGADGICGQKTWAALLAVATKGGK